MKNEMKNMDVVALAQDIPEQKLLKGQVGTVVEALDDNFFEIEFIDNSGKTYALHAINKNRIMKIT